MREQDEEEKKCKGRQSVGYRGGGGTRRGGRGSCRERYHSIAHLFLRQPARILYGLTCPRHIDRKGHGGGGGREWITIIIQPGLRNHIQHREEEGNKVRQRYRLVDKLSVSERTPCLELNI
ncbi:hypothetical protein ATANTOWER_022410 [Ataeniobius toweri]|uniref:Uncharacterized protein n=1 Tax=Ataeniobius toweri TaxID=208326 RepID=A0ABU7BVD2_9TELE|nr:hypothetical protein [Ataeniobius toweri]